MSFLRKLFSGTTAEEEAAKAEALAKRGDHGAAKLAFERALAKSDDDATRDALGARVREQRDAIAARLVDEATALAALGRRSLARQELENALEAAGTDAARSRVRDALRALDLAASSPVVTDHAEALDDESKLALIAGGWDEAQSAEYERYGDAFSAAIVALHDGRAEDARGALEALAARAPDAVYLLLELGRARLLDGDVTRGTEAIEAFLAALDRRALGEPGPDGAIDDASFDEGGEARLSAHLELARLADARGDVDVAIREHERAATALPDDPRPLFALGRYLRAKGLPAEAAEVLEAARDLVDESRPDVRILEELGLAFADAGDVERAVESLEHLLGFHVRQGELRFPPAGTRALARLHEEAGRLERAADLFRALARDADPASQLRLHLDIARVLERLGLHEEAVDALERARSLSGEGDAHLDEIERALSRLRDSPRQ